MGLMLNLKDDDDDAVVVPDPAVVLTLAELVGSGRTGCLTTNLDKIGTSATNTPHSYKYAFDIDSQAAIRFTTEVYLGATCAGGGLLSVTFPAVGGVQKNTFKMTDVNGVRTLYMNKDDTNHLEVYSFGKATYPTSASFQIDYY